MTFSSQLSRGLRVCRCEGCGEAFWSNPETASKVRAKGHMLRCRECMTAPAPLPFARRLTEEELDEMELEIARNQLLAENVQPKPERKPADPSLPEDTVIRILRNHVVKMKGKQHPDNVKSVAIAAGVNQMTLKNILEGDSTRHRNRETIAALSKVIIARGWHVEKNEPTVLSPEQVSACLDGPKPYGDFLRDRAKASELPPAEPEERRDESELTDLDKLELIGSIMNGRIAPDRKVALCKKLFGSLFPAL